MFSSPNEVRILEASINQRGVWMRLAAVSPAVLRYHPGPYQNGRHGPSIDRRFATRHHRRVTEEVTGQFSNRTLPLRFAPGLASRILTDIRSDAARD